MTGSCGQSAAGNERHGVNISTSSIARNPTGNSQSAGVEQQSLNTSNTGSAGAVKVAGDSQSAGDGARHIVSASNSSIAKKLAGDAQLSRLEESIQKLRSAAAAGARGGQAMGSGPSIGTHQQKQQQDTVGAASSGQGLIIAMGGTGQGGTAGSGLNGGVVAAVTACDVGKTPTAQGSRRVSREASRQSSFTASTREQLQPVGGGATATLTSGTGVGVGSASHGLSNRSNLQRWAQPQQREQQQQVLSRQHSNNACGNRRVTGGSSGRSSLV